MNDRILIVDDEDSLRLSMKMRLKGAGFDVEEASDGEQALDKIRENQYDVVLLDIKMPTLSGLDALPMIVQTSPKTDVIMMTGFADFSDAIECLKAGAKDYLVKPIEVTELVTRLKTLLRTRQSERELQTVQHHYSSILFYDLFGPLMTIRDIVHSANNVREKDQEALLAYATELSEQLSSKVRGMLDFTHIESGVLALNRKKFDIAKLVNQICDRQRILAQKNKVSLEKVVQQKLHSSHCDGEKIEQVLNYFLTAAIQNSERGAEIKVSAANKAGDNQVKDQVQVSVRSSNSNVQEEDLSILFHKNGKPVDGRNTKLQETVLNLAIAKRLIEAHGGLFWIGPKEKKSIQYNFSIPVA
ncbi:MAG: response regulator [Ignavibacteriales bacterium]|nr:response regulator [Ignavibacteriales bacterium]